MNIFKTTKKLFQKFKDIFKTKKTKIIGLVIISALVFIHGIAKFTGIPSPIVDLLALSIFPIIMAGILILLSPAIFLANYIGRKEKKHLSTYPLLQILSYGFLVPFINFIYYNFPYFPFSAYFEPLPEFLSCLALPVGFVSLFILIPLTFLVSFGFKKTKTLKIIAILFLNFTLGWGLIMFSAPFQQQMREIAFEQYNPLISKLEKYKQENGSYPNSLKDLKPDYFKKLFKINIDNYSDFKYEKSDGYTLSVKEKGSYSFYNYYYCSSPQNKACNKDDYESYIKKANEINSWVSYEYYYDD